MRPVATGLWPTRRTLWRWHFYAGVFSIPFIVLLCLTGTVYLFKPQIDRLIDRPYDQLAAPGQAVRPPAAQIAAARAAVPGGTLMAYELSHAPGDAGRVILLDHGAALRVYVHPVTLKVLKRVREDWRFERIVFNLHGQLLLGNAGSVVMELVASWAIVLLLTGLALWWPREGGAAGVLYPRLGRGRRTLWRDLHAVTASWLSVFALFLLISGLPWAYVWGSSLAELRGLATASRPPAPTDWEIGHVPARRVIAPSGPGQGSDPQAGTMDDMPGMSGPMTASAAPTAPADAVIAAARRLKLAAPVLALPPKHAGGDWTVRSDAQDRTLRTTLAVAPDGTVRWRHDFAGKPLLDRAIGIGVAAHEGHLFGWANIALNAVVALGLMLSVLSVLALWLLRRPAGRLGAPATDAAPLHPAFVVVIVALALLLPELGMSMLLVLLAERLLLRRIVPVRDWLGLRA